MKISSVKILVLIVFALAQLAAAQEQKPAVDCSGKLDTPSCQTFQKMLSAKARDVMSMFSGQTYVCFRTDEDTFFVISFHEPLKASAGTPGEVKYHRFKNGASDDFRTIAGEWKTADSQPVFASTVDNKLPPVERTSAVVNDRSVVVSYSFLNHEKAEVKYRLQLRRQGLDYLEDYEWPDTKTTMAQSGEHFGKCAEFR